MIIALLMLVSNAMAEGRRVYRSQAEGCKCFLEAVWDTQSDDGSGYIEIYLCSKGDITSENPNGHQFFAFQMFMELNEGIILIPDEEEEYGEYVVIPSDRFGNTDKKKAKYGIQIAKKGNGYQMVCLNQQGNAILGTDGLLLTIPVKDVPYGADIIGQITEIEFTDLEGKAIRFGPEEIDKDAITIIKTEVPTKTYNLRGQETSDSSKGLLIRNRKKIFNK